MIEDKIKISYEGALVMNSCPYLDYETFDDWLLKAENKIGRGYCKHPNGAKKDCNYGVTEIHVPSNCPLKTKTGRTKEGNLVKIVELISEKD